MSRWEHCVTNSDEEARLFIHEYFSRPDRRVLIIAGAGFDPRSAVVTEAVAAVAAKRSGIWVREERANPSADLIARAEARREAEAAVPNSVVRSIAIFDPQDGAVVGAKRLIRQIAALPSDGQTPTDIVLDLSAFSIGMSFPSSVMFSRHTAFRPVGQTSIYL